MPTSATLSALASASFTCLASTAYSASASSSGWGIFFKVLLQDDCGGLVVDPFAAPLRQHRGRITLVDQHSVDAEAAMQLVGETAAAHGHFMLAAIRVA